MARVDQEAIDAWAYSCPNQRGVQSLYRDTAIRFLLTLHAVSHLPLRAAQGFSQSIPSLMGLPLVVPHYGTLPHQAAVLAVDLARKGKGPLHLILDRTGLKAHGEGEWEVRNHDSSKGWTWRKLYLAFSDRGHEKQAVSLTEPGGDDAEEADGS